MPIVTHSVQIKVGILILKEPMLSTSARCCFLIGSLPNCFRRAQLSGFEGDIRNLDHPNTKKRASLSLRPYIMIFKACNDRWAISNTTMPCFANIIASTAELPGKAQSSEARAHWHLL